MQSIKFRANDNNFIPQHFKNTFTVEYRQYVILGTEEKLYSIENYALSEILMHCSLCNIAEIGGKLLIRTIEIRHV